MKRQQATSVRDENGSLFDFKGLPLEFELEGIGGRSGSLPPRIMCHVSAGIATVVSGIGASVGIPIGGVAALTGLSSTSLTAFSKKLQNKLTKLKQTYTLAINKHKTVCELVSKALNDNETTDGEFNLTLCELQKYHELKAAIRSANNKQSGKPQPDIDDMKKQIRPEERQNLQKKFVFGRRVEVEFERVNAGFKLCLTKKRLLNYK